MSAMTAEVSRALAAFAANLGLGQDAARLLADQYATVESADDLPEWLTEQADDGPDVQAAAAIDTHPPRGEHAGPG